MSIRTNRLDLPSKITINVYRRKLGIRPTSSHSLKKCPVT